MKRLSLILAFVLFAAVFMALPVSAANGGTTNLADVTVGKIALMNPEFVDGGEGFGDESPENTLDYSLPDYFDFSSGEDPEKGVDFSKYCGRDPYWVSWKYPEAYVATRFIMKTANDNSLYGRRPNGYTISGSADGAAWTVLYNGTYADMEDKDWAYFYVDFPNTTAYQYYKFEAVAISGGEWWWEGPADGSSVKSINRDGEEIELSFQDIAQFCRFMLCIDAPIPEAPAAAAPEAASPEAAAPAPAPAPAPATPAAPQTGDTGMIALAAAMLFAAAVIFKKKIAVK